MHKKIPGKFFTFIGKNSSLISARDKAKIEYITERQPSPYELAFGVS